MYRIEYSYDGIPLGSSLSDRDDIFAAVGDGREKAKMIAGALKVKIPEMTPGRVEIKCSSYSPQIWLFDPKTQSELIRQQISPVVDTFWVQPNGTTIKTMRNE